MPRLSPEAIYDSLYVVDFSTPKGYAITLSEVTYFCYLACLLSVYQGHPAGKWGYSFAATKSISPFSDALGEAIELLTEQGRFVVADGGYNATSAAADDLERYSRQHFFSSRSQFLRAACNSSLAVPLPMVGTALTQEPSLRRALSVSATRELLTDDFGPRALHRHFGELSKELPNDKDLFLAAVTWLTMLSEQAVTSADVGVGVPPTLSRTEDHSLSTADDGHGEGIGGDDAP